MLCLPSKPWKKIKVDQLDETRYRISFVSPIADEKEFQKAVDEDLGLCISGADVLGEAQWESLSVDLTTEDFDLFKKRLVYVCIMIEEG